MSKMFFIWPLTEKVSQSRMQSSDMCSIFTIQLSWMSSSFSITHNEINVCLVDSSLKIPSSRPGNRFRSCVGYPPFMPTTHLSLQKSWALWSGLPCSLLLIGLSQVEALVGKTRGSGKKCQATYSTGSFIDVIWFCHGFAISLKATSLVLLSYALASLKCFTLLCGFLKS